ncbi:maleylpyruvate isomerase family mycothiol-dependent enzyme [Actinokineospora auranticolor]|nr:maleylpyruvate isomerase family mycothiol-dependent enzyme [Actinokineospora auranticolor]
MGRDEVSAWTEAERLGVVELLADLDDAEWRAGSLCAGWTVWDVAAHLALSTRTSVWGMFGGMLRYRGDFDRMVDEQARARAARYGPTELVGQLRDTAGSARRNPLAAPLDPLADVLVHVEDIIRPLGRPRPRPVPPERVAAALGHLVAARFWGVAKRLGGAVLVATDHDWRGGDGPDEVRGPLVDLLLIATGRPAGLAGVTGPGVGRLAL